jgi:hypothetical protein
MTEKTALEEFVRDWAVHQPAAGRVIFACTGDHDYADISTWTFDDPVYTELLASGYRSGFLQLLNKLIAARMEAGQLPNSGGEALFTRSAIDVHWTTASEALAWREVVYLMEKA